jgi:HSP20 family protein
VPPANLMDSIMIRVIRLRISASPPGRPEQRVVHLQAGTHSFVTGGSPAWEPPADVYETEREVVVEICLAGVQPSIVRIEMTPRCVQFYGNRPEPAEAMQRRYHLLEIERGPFARSVKLPVPVHPASAQVSYADGLLTVRLAKTLGGHAHACNAANSVEGFE